MSEAPQTLSRPLADRVQSLPQAPVAAPTGLGMGPGRVAALVAGAEAALAAGKTKYTDRPGIPALRTWIASHLKQRFDVPYTPDEVTVTCGVEEARFVAIKVLCEPGTHLICPGDPARIAGAVQLAGGSVHSTVQDPARVAALYLSPDDPDTAPLLENAKAHQWPILYEPYYGSTTFHPAQDEALRPLTLSIGDLDSRDAGWRVGWMAGFAEHGRLRAYKQSMTICTTSISQWAMLGLVEAQA